MLFKNFLFPVIIFLHVTVVSAQIFPDTLLQKQKNDLSEDALGRSTPRGTVQGFISAVANQDYYLASRFLNLETIAGNQDGTVLAQTLQNLLDQGYLQPYSRISNDSSGNTDDDLPAQIDRIGTITVGGETIGILLERIQGPLGDDIWLFASETLSKIINVTTLDGILINELLPAFLIDYRLVGVPLGHWLAAILLIFLAYLLAWIVIRIITGIIRLLWKKSKEENVSGIITALVLPIRIYLALWLFIYLSQQAGLSIILRQKFSGLVVIVGVVALVILLWRLTDLIATFSKKKMIKRESVSGMSVVLFVQRATKATLIIIGVIAILGALGIDVTTGIAALGIGGIALALGAQKSMENLVGSVTLVADQPIRVGDFCKVGDTIGTIESIGMRSTRIRTLNRTVVTIPNGEFSSGKIENYAHRDKFWFHPIFNLRYETTPDQIRYLLVEMRAVLYAHPKVHTEPNRVRLIQIGVDSIDLEVFAYINTTMFDEFLEIQEDLLLHMMDLVEKSGTSFAFPSQTVYLTRDRGRSNEKSEKAEGEVHKWKNENNLQLPRFDPEQIEKLRNSINYPPEGSVNRKMQNE